MSKSNVMPIIGKNIIRLLPLVLVVALSVPIIGMGVNEGERLVGLKTVPVPVEGTGSMYPSLYWSKTEGGPEDETKKVIEEYRNTPNLYRRFSGITINGHTFFKRQISDGDIVAFKDAATAKILASDGKDTNAGFIKRVIGVPGDTLELRDGFVYRNGSLLSEPYIAAPRSTYGGPSLEDCVKITIPTGQYFVMGDNRKVSSDSRFELGLIHDQDIEYVLPLSNQGIYQKLWRNTTGDASLLGQPTLAADEFVSRVNAVRGEQKLRPLTLKAALNKSAASRGQHLLADKNTSYSMQQAMSGAGYTNIVLGEFISYGHYTASELVENLLYNSGSSKQILNKEYTDIGIAAVDQNVNGCPTQIIVGHLGGYIPASYDQATMDSWHALLDNLQSIIPTWEKAKDYPTIDQGKLAALLTILNRREALAKEVVTAMDNKAWLTADQQARMKNDESDATAAEDLINQINKTQT